MTIGLVDPPRLYNENNRDTLTYKTGVTTYALSRVVPGGYSSNVQIYWVNNSPSDPIRQVLIPDIDYYLIDTNGQGRFNQLKLTYNTNITDENKKIKNGDKIYVFYRGTSTYNFTPSSKSVTKNSLADDLKTFRTCTFDNTVKVTDQTTLELLEAVEGEEYYELPEIIAKPSALLVYIDGTTILFPETDYGIKFLNSKCASYLQLKRTLENSQELRIVYLGFITGIGEGGDSNANQVVYASRKLVCDNSDGVTQGVLEFNEDDKSETLGEKLVLSLKGSTEGVRNNVIEVVLGTNNTANHLAKINAGTGTLNTAFDVSKAFNGNVTAIEYAIINEKSYLFVGGNFTKYMDTNTCNGLAKIDAVTGEFISNFNTTTGFSLPESISIKTILYDNGKLYIGGVFTEYNGVSATNLVKIDATTAQVELSQSVPVFDTRVGFNGSVNTLAINGNNLYVGGSFTTYNETTKNRYVILNKGTASIVSNDNDYGFNGDINDLIINGESIYFVGNFTNYLSNTDPSLIRIDSNKIIKTAIGGSYDNSLTSYFTGDNATSINKIIINNNKIYCVGSFTLFNNATKNRIVKLNSDGSLSTDAINNTSGFEGGVVNDVVYNGNYLYCVGAFTSFNGVERNKIVKINATTGEISNTFGSATGSNNEIKCITFFENSIVIGGIFTKYENAEPTAVYPTVDYGMSAGRSTNHYNNLYTRNLTDTVDNVDYSVTIKELYDLKNNLGNFYSNYGRTLIDTMIPVGTILLEPMGITEDDLPNFLNDDGTKKKSSTDNDAMKWERCDGQSKLVAEYSVLNSKIKGSYGSSNTNFFLPDLRTKLLGTNRDTSGFSITTASAHIHTMNPESHTHTISGGSTQTITIGSHNHTINLNNFKHTHTGSVTNSNSAHYHNVKDHTHSINVSGGSVTINNSSPSHSHTLSGNTGSSKVKTISKNGVTESTCGGAAIDSSYTNEINIKKSSHKHSLSNISTNNVTLTHNHTANLSNPLVAILAKNGSVNVTNNTLTTQTDGSHTHGLTISNVWDSGTNTTSTEAKSLSGTVSLSGLTFSSASLSMKTAGETKINYTNLIAWIRIK